MLNLTRLRTLHWTKTSHLPHDPAELLVVLRCAWRIADLSLLVVLIGQIEKDRSTLKHTLLAVGDGRNPAIGIDLEEPPGEGRFMIDGPFLLEL